jgi:hypothetical protein
MGKMRPALALLVIDFAFNLLEIPRTDSSTATGAASTLLSMTTSVMLDLVGYHQNYPHSNVMKSTDNAFINSVFTNSGATSGEWRTNSKAQKLNYLCKVHL